MPIAYYLQLPLEFPEGVHFGGGDNYNSLRVARDGRGTPVLNGSSLAGMLRSIWTDFQVANQYNTEGKSAYEIAKLRDDARLQRQVNELFGAALGSDGARENAMPDMQSCVKVTNYRLQTSPNLPNEKLTDEKLEMRTFHLNNRHVGSVVKNGLFSIEACPPGTRVTAGIWILDHNEVIDSDIEQFIDVTVGAFKYGVHVGGKSNRGFGRAVVNDAEVRMLRFNLTQLDSHAAYLEAHREWRQTGKVADAGEYTGASSSKLFAESLLVELTLQIPKGQDLLVASGRASEVNAEPQCVSNASGQMQWRLPGSSLRGMFYKWFHHLDARDRIANNEFELVDRGDAAIDYCNREYTSRGRAWCFQADDKLDAFEVPEAWRVTSLFGSC